MKNNSKKATATKTATVVTKTIAPVKIEVVVLGKTTYHYFRNFIRPLFKANNVISAKFIKVEGYNGHINISKAEKVKAAKLIADKVKADESVDLIWA